MGLTTSQFAAQYGAQALAAQQATGIDAATLLAMAYQEGAGVASTISAQGTFFDLKSAPAFPTGNAGTITIPAAELINGSWTTITSTFLKFTDFYQASLGLKTFLQTYGYSSALADAGNPNQFIVDLKAKGWATDPTWVNSVQSLRQSFASVLGGQSQGSSQAASTPTPAPATSGNPAQQILTNLGNGLSGSGQPSSSSPGGGGGTGPVSSAFADFFHSVSGPTVIIASVMFLIVGFLIWHGSSGGKIKLPNVIVANAGKGAAASGGTEAAAAAAA